MGGLSTFHWLIVLVVVFLLFGNRLPSVMRSLGRGVTEFKKGMEGIEDDTAHGPHEWATFASFHLFLRVRPPLPVEAKGLCKLRGRFYRPGRSVRGEPQGAGESSGLEIR